MVGLTWGSMIMFSARGASVNWTVAELSNVYGGAYENPHVHPGAPKTVDSEAECRAQCAADQSCVSYTWWPGPQVGHKCNYVHQCYWRDDHVWNLKNSSNCAAISGFKGGAPAPAPSPPAPPGAMNVLFVIYDDLRVMHEPWGFTQTHTPTFNLLAKKSLIFDNAYCNQAVCGPSRASLLSGRRPDTTQMWNFIGSFRDTPGASQWNTWPEYFQKQGYYTAGAGKLFHPGDPADFDPQSWTGEKYGGYFGQDKCPIKTNSHGCPVPDSVNHKFPDLETLAVAKQQLGIAASDRSKPFWIGTGFVKPHMPHVFPEKYLSMVPPASDIVLAKHQQPPNGTAAAMDWYTGAEGPGAGIMVPASKAMQQDWRVNYYAAAAFSDDVLAQLLAEVDRLNFTDSTLVVVTADHGWGLGEHNHWIKYTNWETDARVPLLIHDPRASRARGVHTQSLVEHVDLYPTLAELAGVPVTHETIEGASFAELFSSKIDPASTIWTNSWNASFTQYPRCGERINPDGTPNFDHIKRCADVHKEDFVYMGYSIRTVQWRYTEWARWNGTTLKPIWTLRPTAPTALVELYNHDSVNSPTGAAIWDDFENTNEAAANPQIVDALSARLRAFYDGSTARRNSPFVTRDGF